MENHDVTVNIEDGMLSDRDPRSAWERRWNRSYIDGIRTIFRATCAYFIESKQHKIWYLHEGGRFKNTLIPPVIVPGPPFSVITPVIMPIVVVSLPVEAVTVTIPVIPAAVVTGVVRARVIHPIRHGEA